MGYRDKFHMVRLGFLNENNASTEKAKQSLPRDLEECPAQEIVSKTVIFSMMKALSEDQPSFWGTKDTVVMKPKNKGLGIMVSILLMK